MQIPNEFSISSLSFKYKDYTHKFRIRLLRKLNNFIQKEFKHLKTLPPNELITNLNKFEIVSGSPIQLLYYLCWINKLIRNFHPFFINPFLLMV